MPASLIPIGHFIGAFSAPQGGEASGPAGAYGVRLGTKTVDLFEQEFGVWALARGLAEENQKTVSVASLTKLVRRADLDDAEPTIESLISRKLLTRVLETGSSVRQFAQHHQLMPLGIGLGNSRQELLTFTVGNPEFPRAKVTAEIYDLWAFGTVSGSLWQACEKAAELDEDASAQDLARLAVQALPVLLATDAAYVDVAAPTSAP